MAESATQARLTLLGRAMLEQAGFTDADARKVRQRLLEGLDAVQVKTWMHEGLVVEDVPRVDYSERRQAAVEGAKILDWYPNKLEHEVTGAVTFNLLGLDGDRV